MQKDVYIINGVRTPVGDYGGALKNIDATALARHVIGAAIDRCELTKEDVDLVYLGNCFDPVANNIARIASVRSGLPVETPAVTVSSTCGSSMQAVALGVQAIKGVEFGPAFENTRLPGTRVHDPIQLSQETSDSHDSPGSIIRPSNRAGGLEGGITNGQPLIIRAAMKPIATTLTPQQTIDLASGKETQTVYERSDFCPVPRAVPVIESVVAFVLADALLEKLGGDSLTEMQTRFKTLRQMTIQDLRMDNTKHIFWPDK